MLERLSPSAGHESAGSDSALRMPEWSELAARLGAARELRAALGGSQPLSSGGFAGFCSSDSEQVNNESADVNLTGLVHGKYAAATLSQSAEGSPQADREMQ